MNSLKSLILSKQLERYTLHAVDGEVGGMECFYFDDLTWAIRYIVVNTGNWLSGRRVLISPVAIGQVKKHDKEIHIELTREQIRSSPHIEKDETILRHYEEEYYHYYGWPPYWEAGPFSVPPQINSMTPPSEPPKSAKSEPNDFRLRNSADVKGYDIISLNGKIGNVEDFVIDTQYWLLRYVKIRINKPLRNKHVLVNSDCISRVSWAMQAIYVNLTREVITDAPPYDPTREIEPEYENSLLDYYDQHKL